MGRISKGDRLVDLRPLAKKKLVRYEAMKTALECIPAEIRRLEYEAKRIRASSAIEVPNKDKLLFENVRLRTDLEQCLIVAKECVETTDIALDALDAQDKLLLAEMFMRFTRGTADRMCEVLDVTEAAVYRRRNKALNRFTLQVYGCLDTAEIPCAEEDLTDNSQNVDEEDDDEDY